MRIAIIDDETIYLQIIEDIIQQTKLTCDIHSYSDYHLFLEDSLGYDVVLLDIQMPETDGIELSKRILSKTRYIVFVTSLKERVFDAFNKNVMGYVLKENMKDTLPNVLYKIHTLLQKQKMTFKCEDGEYIVDKDDIYYIRIENRKFYLYLKDRSIQIYVHSFNEIIDSLPSFIFTDRSCLVNSKNIQILKEDSIVLYNTEELTISRRKIKEFKKEYLRLQDYGI